MSAQESESLPDHFRALTLESLRILVAVEQAGSLRSASDQLLVSQPTVGRAVSALEKQLDASLLERSPRGVRLTAEGEIVARSARRILRAAGDLREEVRGAGGTQLRLGATATSANAFLAPFLAEWLPENPQVTVTAIEDGEQNLSRIVVAGDCDVAIVSTPLPDDLESLHLATVDVVAVFPAHHQRSAGRHPIDVAQLADEPLLVNGMKYPSTRLVVHAMEVAGVAPRIVYESGVGRTLASMAAAGLGVAVFGSTADLTGMDLRPRTVTAASGEPLTFDFHVAWSARRSGTLPKEFGISLATFHRSRGGHGPSA